MLKSFVTNYWPILLVCAIPLLAAWPIRKYNRNAARKGKNPINLHLTHRRNAFLKEPQPYTDDRRINRHWKP